MSGRLIALVAAILSASSVVPFAKSKPSIQGVWRVIEVTTTGPDGFHNREPQPGLFIFTRRHYSIIRDGSREVRPTVTDPNNITAAEALAIFGPLMAQSGSYEVTDTTLKVTPMVAKVPPPNGRYGGSNSWTFKVGGDTLWLTQLDDLKERLAGLGGKTPNPMTLRLIRVE